MKFKIIFKDKTNGRVIVINEGNMTELQLGQTIRQVLEINDDIIAEVRTL